MEDKAICLDTTDWKILEALQKNARSTFTEIGQSVGLTAPAVRERIRRLESDELITGYRPVINYAVLGRPIRALIALKFKSGSRAADGTTLAHSELFNGLAGVVRWWFVTGDTECVLEAAAPSMKQLDATLETLNRWGFLTVTYMILDDSGEVNCRRL